jgi:broad specificity phosphatase PhoE
MILHLFRHGETDWNLEKRLQGQIMDPPVHLNNKGVGQAKEAAVLLKDKSLDVIFSSDLHRALETAEIVADVYSLDIIQDSRLRETDFGELQGSLYDEDNFKYFTHSELKFPGGESLDEAKLRALSVLKEIALKYNYSNVGIATHGGVIGNLRAAIEGKSYKHVENGEVFSVEYDEETESFQII